MTTIFFCISISLFSERYTVTSSQIGRELSLDLVDDLPPWFASVKLIHVQVPSTALFWNELDATVLGAAFFCIVGRYRFTLTCAQRAETSRRNAKTLDKFNSDGVRPCSRELHVEIGTADAIGVTDNAEGSIRMSRKVGGDLFDSRPRLGPDDRAIEIKMDAIERDFAVFRNFSFDFAGRHNSHLIA